MPLDHADTVEKASQSALWIYERFETGEHIGTSTQIVNQAICDRWNALYKNPRKEGVLPYGIIQLIAMRAYTEVVQPRPSGNIHAAHFCKLAAVPSLNNELKAQVYCVGKYLKRERKMVDFSVRISDAESGHFLCDTTLSICWSK